MSPPNLPISPNLTTVADRTARQVLNCVRQAARGGETLLVDGLSVVRRLAEQRPSTLAYLSCTPLPWFSYDEARLPVRLSQREVAVRLEAVRCSPVETGASTDPACAC